MVGQITERVFEAYFWAILGILKGMYEFKESVPLLNIKNII